MVGYDDLRSLFPTIMVLFSGLDERQGKGVLMLSSEEMSILVVSYP